MAWKRFRHIVQPPEEFQVGIVQRLHAERHAVDARGAIAAEPLGLDRGRIGLQRDLDAVRHGPVLRHRIEYGLHRFGLHQRRRAAAQKYAGHLARAGAGAHVAKFRREGGGKALLVHRLVAHMAN